MMGFWMFVVAAWLAAWGVLLTHMLGRGLQPRDRQSAPLSLLDGEEPRR